MSARKVLKDNSQSSDDEAEHERLRKEHEQNEKESINDMKEIDDVEYNRMIKISWNSRNGDANMEDLNIVDDDEENVSNDNDKGNNSNHHNDDDDEEEKEDEDRKMNPFAKKTSHIDSFAQTLKKQTNQVSSFARMADITRDSEISSRFYTPQKPSNSSSLNSQTNSFNRMLFSSDKDLEEELRQGIVQNVKVRIKELQSKMKSKSDMFYVLRHMCKIYNFYIV